MHPLLTQLGFDNDDNDDDKRQPSQQQQQQQQKQPSMRDIVNYLLQNKLLLESQFQMAYDALMDMNQSHATQEQKEKQQGGMDVSHSVVPSNNDNNYNKSLVVSTNHNDEAVTEAATLEGQSKHSNNHETGSNTTTTTITTTTPADAAAADTINRIDRTRMIALQFYYDGSGYTGLAENMGSETDASVEKELFAALEKTNLLVSSSTKNSSSSSSSSSICDVTITNSIKDRSHDRSRIRHDAKYSRCGRTDKGVSSAGQVVSLLLKSNICSNASWDEAGTQLIQDDELPINAFQSLKNVWIPPRNNQNKSNNNNHQKKKKKGKQQQQQAPPPPRRVLHKTIKEYPYDQMLNHVLPISIRILGWCPVSNDFNARFSTTTRTYRYFFIQRKKRVQHQQHDNNNNNNHTHDNDDDDDDYYNMTAMKQALQYMVGKHDFRNFCKMDVEKVYNFERYIVSADIVPVATAAASQSNNNSNNNNKNSNNNHDVYYFEICGQAFLWHQIRCIVSIVLDMIGRNKEPPEIVLSLLNTTAYPGKPSYPLASELPLVLHHCQYQSISQFGYSVSNLWMTCCELEREWNTLMLQAARIRNCIQQFETNKNNNKNDHSNNTDTTSGGGGGGGGGGVLVSRQDVLEFAKAKLHERWKKNQKYYHSRVKSSTNNTSHKRAKPTTSESLLSLSLQEFMKTIPEGLPKGIIPTSTTSSIQNNVDENKDVEMALEEEETSDEIMETKEMTTLNADTRKRPRQQQGADVNVQAEEEGGYITWSEALFWMEQKGLIMGPDAIRETVHIPLLKRHMGPSYEEKVHAMTQSTTTSKRRLERYEENIIQKRSTKQEDKSFYQFMTQQGGSAM